jgi:hypothetical protein
MQLPQQQKGVSKDSTRPAAASSRAFVSCRTIATLVVAWWLINAAAGRHGGGSHSGRLAILWGEVGAVAAGLVRAVGVEEELPEVLRLHPVEVLVHLFMPRRVVGVHHRSEECQWVSRQPPARLCDLAPLLSEEIGRRGSEC